MTDNTETYATAIDTQRNNFFVIVRGTVKNIEITDYSKEDLSIMENKDAAELLSKTIGYKYYIEDCNTPISISTSINVKEPNINIRQEYYFL